MNPSNASWSKITCLSVAAVARLLLQVVAMPPYAGLDEGFHVARVAYVANEGSQPSAVQPSVPLYLARSMAGSAGAPPAFGTIAAGWPALIASRPEGWQDVPLDLVAQREYVAPNYEVQQPSLYYAVVAPVVRPFATQLEQLFVLRLIAVLCGVVTVVATGLLAVQLWGGPGLLAGLLLLATPDWVTLVARAGNDAPACMALAVALLLSSRRDGGRWASVAEAGWWAAAIALKVYTWPAALLLPLVWPRHSARGRRLLVAGSVGIAGVLTALDLVARTGNPIGSQAFWRPEISVSGVSLEHFAKLPWWQITKVFLGTAIWTSGQHANFFRPAGLGLFLLPWIVLAVSALLVARSVPVAALRLLAAAAAVFAVAEVAHGWGLLWDVGTSPVARQTAGLPGWYLHAFDPIWFGVGGGWAVATLVRRRWTGVLVVCLVGMFATDLFVTEGALFCDYAGLSLPSLPGTFFRWGGGRPWEALERLGRYGLFVPSPWLAVLLRLAEVGSAAAVVALSLRAVRRVSAEQAGVRIEPTGS
jgi:hypothetical protein